MLKVAVLVSGGGTNLQAILDAVDEGLIARDPTRKTIIKGKTPRAKKPKYLSQFELHTLLKHLDLSSDVSWDWLILLVAKTGMRFSTTLIDSIVSVDHACNMVVLKTYAGLAQAVAVGLDSMNMQQVLGCVAGDDTIMIVARDVECATVIADRIRELMKTV